MCIRDRSTWGYYKRRYSQIRNQESPSHLNPRRNADSTSTTKMKLALTIYSVMLISWSLAVTHDQLWLISRPSSYEIVRNYSYHIDGALHHAHMYHDCPRQAAFLAEISVNTKSFSKFEEDPNCCSHLDTNEALGNFFPGDGNRFRGRGAIRIKGRKEYHEASKALGIDLVKNPELAGRPEWAFKIASWVWTKLSLNSIADRNTELAFFEIIGKIHNCLPDCRSYAVNERISYWSRAKKALGCQCYISSRFPLISIFHLPQKIILSTNKL
eukprot:TRINITY_DN6882_c0_g1_i1.p1 TRINITY_DN6882_c0_g1~~TRINITY_DN6882_c0_g1_i1.p1  ORF type:complete len:290 (-),score=45.40 TRINITY_DN6882_c0_g1_i1:100-909(-)